MKETKGAEVATSKDALNTGEAKCESAYSTTAEHIAVAYNDNVVPVKLYRRRFVVLVLYALLNALLGFLWLTYTPMIDTAAEFYDVSEESIDFFTQIFFIVFIPGIFVVNFFIGVFGVRAAVIVGCAAITLGSWLRYIANHTFWLALFGQGLVAVALVLTFSLPPRLAADWFPEKERVMATSVCVVFNQVGSALGAFFPGQLVDDNVDKMRDMLLYEAIITSAIALPNVIVFRSQPPSPPSPSSEKKITEGSLSPWEETKQLLFNKQFIMLYIIEGIAVGSYATILAIVDQVLGDIDSSSTVGNISFVLQLAGIPGVMILVPLLTKSKRYKVVLLSVMTFVSLSLVGFTVSVYYVHIPTIYVTSALVGFFWYASVPLLYEFAAELSYPVSESTSSGLLNQAMYLFALGFTFALQKQSPLLINVFFISTVVLSTVLGFFFVNEELRRIAIDV
eukprot:Nk52_evm79s2118 gene=Nk52_evmTU79s2118